jgi:hypothetical protein
MAVSTEDHPVTTVQADDVVEVHRRTIDKVLISFGLIAAMVFAPQADC